MELWKEVNRIWIGRAARMGLVSSVDGVALAERIVDANSDDLKNVIEISREMLSLHIIHYRAELERILKLISDANKEAIKKKLDDDTNFIRYSKRIREAYGRKEFGLKADGHMWHYMYMLSYESYVYSNKEFGSGRKELGMQPLAAPTDFEDTEE
jgi:hypothetical protein